LWWDKVALGQVFSEFFGFPCNLREIGWGGIDWIYLAQNMDQWRALVNVVMNLRVPKKKKLGSS
jgi:hypothetical protein